MSGEFKPNEGQRRAIEFDIDKPLKVVAGAGTGKTAVLAHRFIHLVEKRCISPHRILCLTFTKKAAAEMQARITRELLEREFMSRAEAPLLLWIGNFHSICLRLLRQRPLLVGLDPLFGVIEEAEQRLLLNETAHDFLNGKLGAGVDSSRFDTLMINRVEDFTDNILTVISRVKDHFIAVEDLKQNGSAILAEQYRIVEETLKSNVSSAKRADSRRKAERSLDAMPASKAYEQLLLDAVYEIYKEYQSRLERNDILDFSDIVFQAFRLTRIDPAIRSRFDYILVDEFQDTDNGQYQLLKALSNDFKNVTVVCDKKQSIYEWREARPENIDSFPGTEIALDENYRSFGEILEAANHFIKESMPEQKALRPAGQGGRGWTAEPQVRLFRAKDCEEESEFVACEIQRLFDSDGRKPSDVAILMRSVHAARSYEDALRLLGIRYKTVGGCGFYELNESKDVLALLRLIANPFDDLSMARVLTSPIVGLSDATLYELCKAKNEAERGKQTERTPISSSLSKGEASCSPLYKRGVREDFAEQESCRVFLQRITSIYDVMKEKRELVETFRSETRNRLWHLTSVIDKLANGRWALTIGELISETLGYTGYLKYLTSIEGPRGPRFSNVALFYRIATSFEEAHPGAGLEEFLSYVDEAMAGDAGAVASDPTLDAVQIMTVHQAKGLEFPVVFAVNLRSHSFPLSFRANRFGYDEDFGLFARTISEDVFGARYKGANGIDIEDSLKGKHYGEEKRVMYVAMTRAKELLYLTTSAPAREEKEKKKGKEDSVDFFEYIRKSASQAGNRYAEEVTMIPLVARPPNPQPAPATSMDVEDIKRIATEVLARISQPPAVKVAGGAEVLTLSYSRLSVYRQCPMKYALRYVYNLPLSPHGEAEDEFHPHGGVDAVVLGNLMHKALMQYHRRRKADPRVDAWRILAELSRASDCPRDVARAAQGMMKKYLVSTLSRIDTLSEEKEFHWRLKEGALQILLEGKIDRIHREGDSLKVVDYKTGLSDAEGHRLQLGIYRLAMESVLGTSGILTSDCYLSTGEEIEQRFTTEELSDIRNDILDDARKIASGDFSVDKKGSDEDGDCHGCEYKTFCPS